MAYVAVDADERDGPEGLQFKSFLGDEHSNGNGGDSRPPNSGRTQGVGNADRGYLQDQGPKGASGFWTIEYYQPFFDVTTATVLRRCYTSLIPSFLLPSTSQGASFLSPEGTPDLYGPFWVLTTLIFALFLSSSLASSISVYLSDPGTAEYDYDFQLLTVAVGIVYGYGLGVPVALWGVLRWLGVGEWSVVEAVAVWGYAQFVWIPVAVLCVIPVPIVRWVLVGLAFSLSGYFLVSNVYPVLASADQKSTRLLIILIFILHAGIALTFKLLFFSYYVVKEIGPGVPVDLPGAPGSGGNGTVGARW